jgi:hypothetical protein
MEKKVEAGLKEIWETEGAAKALALLGRANKKYLKKMEKKLAGKKFKGIVFITPEQVFPTISIKFEDGKEILCDFIAYIDENQVRKWKKKR